MLFKLQLMVGSDVFKTEQKHQNTLFLLGNTVPLKNLDLWI